MLISQVGGLNQFILTVILPYLVLCVYPVTYVEDTAVYAWIFHWFFQWYTVLIIQFLEKPPIPEKKICVAVLLANIDGIQCYFHCSDDEFSDKVQWHMFQRRNVIHV